MNLQRADFQVPGFLKGNEFTLKKVYILLPSFFLPPARIPPGTERVLLGNHLHSQKCMRRDSHFSHVGPNFLSLESPPCCLSLVLGPELFPYPPPCCSLSACGINNSPSKLHTPPPMIQLSVLLRCPSETFQCLVFGHAKLSFLVFVCGC